MTLGSNPIGTGILFRLMLLPIILCSSGCSSQGESLKKWTLQQEGSAQKYEVNVPCTVVGALNEAGALGENILDLDHYKQLDKAPFDKPWVFTTQFKTARGQHHVLRFEGLNFYADVELNGVKIASADTTFGTFSNREFDITSLARRNNTLKVTLRRAQSGDLNHGFADWNPRPLDESVGIVRPVSLISTPDVQVQDVFVKPIVDPADLTRAQIEVAVTLVNRSADPVEGSVKGVYDSGSFQADVKIPGNGTRVVKVTETVNNPRIWWTREMGSPEMYHLNVAFENGGKVSHEKGVDFGIRKIEGIVDERGHRQFILNGKKVLIKAGGWTDDIFLQDTPESLKAQMDLVCDMGLNCIRFENIWGKDDEIYDLCDRMGVLALVGWSCQWEWMDYCGLPETRGYGCINDPRSEALAVRYFRDQIIRLRNHPSLIGWLTGSDRIPNERLEKQYLALYEKLEYRPYICSAKGLTSLAGPSGMKMEGPYEFVGPDYWYIDTECGGAFGFNTETGPGLNLPQVESLRRMIGEEQLWPMGKNWAYHCTSSASHMNTPAFQMKAQAGLYGQKAETLEDYVKRAHAMDYNTERAMFEAFRCNVPNATGIVQWMLNSAWPSIYWQLYDWYGIPTAGYYGVKKALRPLQLVYNYGDACAYLVNDVVDKSGVLTANLWVYDTDGKTVLRKETKQVESKAREPLKVFENITGPAYVVLELITPDRKAFGNNIYTIAANNNVYDWEKADWWGLPILEYANVGYVCDLPKTQVGKTIQKTDKGYDITLVNRGETLAYQNILKAKNAQGELIPGTFWTDNFFTLLPGETRVIECTLPAGCKDAQIEIEGWNANVE